MDFSGSLAVLILARRPRPPPYPCPCPPPHPRPSSLPSSSPFSPSSSSLSTSLFGHCGAQSAVVGFVRSPVVVLSGGCVVRYCVVVVVALWGCIVAAVVLSRWWLGFCCGDKVVVVVGLSLWSRGVGLSWWWWGFAVLSGIRIWGRCRFVFAGHCCRLEKLVRGDGRIDDVLRGPPTSWVPPPVSSADLGGSIPLLLVVPFGVVFVLLSLCHPRCHRGLAYAGIASLIHQVVMSSWQ